MRTSAGVLVALLCAAVTALVPTVAAAQSPDQPAPEYVVAPAATGNVYPIGAAPFHGSLADTGIDVDVVDMEATRTGNGYWVASRDGRVFAFGDARFHGDLAGIQLNGPIVGMAGTPSGRGYWLVASDGGVFTFGDAAYLGSMGNIPLVAPMADIAPTASGRGYWTVAEDGGVFTFGDAIFRGSMGGTPLLAPVTAMIPTRSGHGYWLFASDGGVFTFGDAAFLGSSSGRMADERVVSAAAPADGRGYWLVGERGSVHLYGSVGYHGRIATGSDEPVVAIAARPNGDGYWLATTPGRPSVGPPLPAGSGSGRRIVYSNSAQRIWTVEADGRVSDSYLVSGRQGVPAPGSYAVFSKSPKAWAGHHGITMDNMVRFARGRSLAIGFHAIPTYSDGRPLQTETELGQFRSSGCVRQRADKAQRLYDWAPIGTPVIVTP